MSSEEKKPTFYERGFIVLKPDGSPVSFGDGIVPGEKRAWTRALVAVNRRWSVDTAERDTKKLKALGYRAAMVVVAIQVEHVVPADAPPAIEEPDMFVNEGTKP